MNKDIIGIGDIVKITGVLAELYPDFEWLVTDIEYKQKRTFYRIKYFDSNSYELGSRLLQGDELQIVRSADYDLGI